MTRAEAHMADAQEQNGPSDLNDVIILAAECEVCGGSRIEEVYVGHGVVIEYECSKCVGEDA